VTCVPVANPGWVRVSNVTTGPEVDWDDEYTVSCAGLDCRAFTLAANRDTVLRLAPGQLRLGFTGVSPHCTLSSPSTRELTVSAGDTVDAAFPVACNERPSINVIVRTAGRELVDSAYLYICSLDYYASGCRYGTVSSNGSLRFPGIDPGGYAVGLNTYRLPENCSLTGSPYREVEVLGTTVTVEFAITCRAFGTVRVSTVTSGTNPDASYEVVRPSGCDDYYVLCDVRSVPASGSVDFRAAPGPQSFLLRDVASNCAVRGANPAEVEAIEDGLVELRFEVDCR
jgi:hypothetical protein